MRGRGNNIPPMRQGRDGVGIQSGSIDSGGTLTLTLTSGATIVGSLKGPPGDPGGPGTPGRNAAQPTFSASLAFGAVGSAPSATVTSLDGVAWSIALQVPRPKDGTNGTNGTNGVDASSPVFTVSASALAAGTTPTAKLTGTYPNLALAFAIPKGDQGVMPSISIGTVTALGFGATPWVKRRAGDTDAAPILDWGLPAPYLGGTYAVVLPTLAIGVLTPVTVAVPGAAVGMLALATPPASLVPSLSRPPTAIVTAKDVVTLYITASVALAGGTQSFLVRVLP